MQPDSSEVLLLMSPSLRQRTTRQETALRLPGGMGQGFLRGRGVGTHRPVRLGEIFQPSSFTPPTRPVFPRARLLSGRNLEQTQRVGLTLTGRETRTT